MNTKSLVIAFSGHSGAGKSTVIDHLASHLGNTIILRFDDYEESNIYPDMALWLQNGADPNEFDTPQLTADLRALRNGERTSHPDTGQVIQPAHFILLEEPFGRERDAMRDLVDFVVLIDTPMEIALVRKLLRKNNWLPWEDNPQIFIEHLRENLNWYLHIGRDGYREVASQVAKNCDLIVDGTLPPKQIAETVYEAVKQKFPIF